MTQSECLREKYSESNFSQDDGSTAFSINYRRKDQEIATDGGQDGKQCPACDRLSSARYRCDFCGHDLAGVDDARDRQEGQG